MMINNIYDQLVRDENEILYAYQDSEGLTTIGVGVLIDRRGGGITQAESRYLLNNRVVLATSQLSKALPWTVGLSPVRMGALINMCYNLGLKRLLGFPLFLSALQAGNYYAAAAEMRNSLWAKQVGLRAERLAVQIETGVWQ